ncbi:hypothetical protein SNE40_018478 [Patella caerulea]|uniref:Epithelial cell-transforming sequence 2 oncogene-like n=1 Tax=Patella caerulea TaxID=87958 RepID=A0AAN8J7C6_PATCE
MATITAVRKNTTTVTSTGSRCNSPTKIPTKMAITSDDSKILGKITMKRKEATSNTKYTTLKMKTHNSAWTPVVHKPSNDQIFNERRDLVSHWFDMWTDAQRKRFLDVIFQQCKREQNKFVQNWFREHVPMQHLDFTSVLPKFLSVYIFSFLDPKSLSRASQVCWHWKFLSEQDDIWREKCMKYGWYIPYTPADNEYGAWKMHYLACVQTLDYVSGKEVSNLCGTRGDGAAFKRTKRKNGSQLSLNGSQRDISSRPPWQRPDSKPKDLHKSHHAFLQQFNPNDPGGHKSPLHNRWGQLKKEASCSTEFLSRSLDFEIGLDSKRRTTRHRALTSGEFDPRKGNNMTLRESLDLENTDEMRQRELVETGWLPPNRTILKTKDLSGGGSYPMYKNDIKRPGAGNITNPRVVFISSRVPAADLLLDAVMFGVIPIVYEYEGTTIDTLVNHLEQVLEGKKAQSVGIFCHFDKPGELCLVHGCTVTADRMDYPDCNLFFENVTAHMVPVKSGGQYDIFVPLASSENGVEVLNQLSTLTGYKFSSPTGLIGSYNHINTEWSLPYSDGSPPSKYFCTSKLNVWSNVADQAQEALTRCRKIMEPFFSKLQKNIAGQLAGQLVFDVLGQTDIHGVHSITATLTDGLKSLGEQTNVKPLEYLGNYVLDRCETMDEMRQSMVKTDQNGGMQITTVEDGDNENVIDATDYTDNRGDWGDYEDKNIGEVKYGPSRHPKEVTQAFTNTLKNNLNTRKSRFETTRANKSQRLTSEQYACHPEKRTPVAYEILTSETEYNRTLKATKDIFYKPLKLALESNRAIISAPNVQTIFNDLLSIYEVSKELTENLKNRMESWNAQHTCLGDIFIKFCTRLKPYSNFINNYQVILTSIEKCREQSSSFRNFLLLHQRLPQTRMLSLQELLLLPARRIEEYVKLLTWFEVQTPQHHADREDLDNVLTTLKELNEDINQCKKRIERERELVKLQRNIVNCPALFEANRYLIKHLDVSHLRPPTESEVPELRVYQELATVGLYLFNDALVITRRTSQYFPFTRAVDYSYKFEVSLALNRLRVVDIPDSKFVKNAFCMETPKKKWYCAVDNGIEKLNWMTVLEETVRAALTR